MSQSKFFRITATPPCQHALPWGRPRQSNATTVIAATLAKVICCTALLSPAAIVAQTPPPLPSRSAPWQPPATVGSIDDFATPVSRRPQLPISGNQDDGFRRLDRNLQSPPNAARPQTNLATIKPPRDIFTQPPSRPNQRSAAASLSEAPRSAPRNFGFDLSNISSEKFGSGISQANLESASQGHLFQPQTSNEPSTSTAVSDAVTGVTDAATETLSGVEDWVQQQTAGFLNPQEPGQGGWAERLSSTLGGADVKKIGGSLAIVLGGYLALVWILRKINPASNQGIPTEVLEVIGNAPLDSRQNLQLVRLGSKLLLMIHGPDGTQPIGEVTDPAEVEHLVALCNGRGQTANQAVNRSISRHQSNPASGSLNLSANQQNNLSQLLSALEQVNRGNQVRTFEA